MDDVYYMGLALELAQKGRGFTSPNPLVGALVVKAGEILAKGYHRRVGGAHAEANALAEAGPAANGATLYVNLEPCNHIGRTPPCTERIIAADIKRVVFAMHDPNPDVTGGGAEALRRAGVEVTAGVCQKEALRLNETFVKYVQTKRPFVTLKCAATLDGRIATKSGDSKWVTGPAARRYVHDLRHAHDAILVGINTVKTDDPQLTARLEIGPGADPIRIVLDTHLSICEQAAVLRNGSTSDTIIITAPDDPDADRKSKQERLTRMGVKVWPSALKDGRIDLQQLMMRLGQAEITSLLIEGGGQVAGAALRAGVVDKVLFFYAPKILGGDDGIPMTAGPGVREMARALAVEDVRVQQFEDDILIEGYLQRSGKPGQGAGA